MLLALVGSRGLMWRAIPGVAGKRSHLLLSREGPAVLGGCAVPNMLSPPPTTSHWSWANFLSICHEWKPWQTWERQPWKLQNPGPKGKAWEHHAWICTGEPPFCPGFSPQLLGLKHQSAVAKWRHFSSAPRPWLATCLFIFAPKTVISNQAWFPCRLWDRSKC